MAGKVTFLHGRHASVDAGGWVDEIGICDSGSRAIAASVFF